MLTGALRVKSEVIHADKITVNETQLLLSLFLLLSCFFVVFFKILTASVIFCPRMVNLSSF